MLKLWSLLETHQDTHTRLNKKAQFSAPFFCYILLNEEHYVAKITKEIAFGDHTLVLETGEVARQADGAVLVSMNGTQVLVTVVGKRKVVKTMDFSLLQ